MKKLLCAILCVALLLPASFAATGDETTIQQVVGALGVITGDESGDLALSRTVTRAEFAKMLVCASTLKDSVSPTGNASPFRDVPYTHWASNYIKTAVSQGWLTGYLDGSYRPENPVTVAEAATAVLKLLGYASTDFSGSYPSGQMALYASTGLGDGITGSATTSMTRRSCMRLFYNLLSVKTKDGSQKYIEKLGYKLDANGDPDYTALLQSTMDGPVVLTSGGVAAVLGFTPATVYRNGAVSSADALQTYDVLYYSSARKTVWAYARRVTGIYEAASPNKESPTSVTVAGVSYTVDSPSAIAQLGAEGGLAIGSNITVLLGKDGGVVAAYAAEDLSTDLVGVVKAVDTSAYTAANGSSYTAKTYTVTAADGQDYTVQPSNTTSLSAGSLCRVTYGSAGATVSSLKRSSLSGKVSSSSVGNRKTASDIKILDVTGNIGTRVYLARLAGLTLDSGDVIYYELNPAGEIETLILNDVTGDSYTYGIVLSASESSEGMSASGSYTFLIDGQKSAMTTANGTLGASYGPARFIMNGTQVSSVRALTELKNPTSVTDLYVKTEDETHTIWDRAAVYVYQNGAYTQMDRSELDAGAYRIRAYYDKDDDEGGRVRILIATPLSS